MALLQEVICLQENFDQTEHCAAYHSNGRKARGTVGEVRVFLDSKRVVVETRERDEKKSGS